MQWPRVPHLWWFVASTIAVALSGHADFRKIFELGNSQRQLGEIDVARIRELHRITDTFGEQIWPGFDTRKIPVAINNHDRQELLIGHPAPPPEFHPFGQYRINEQPVMMREGVTRYGPQGGGWAVDLGGVQSAYVGTLSAGLDTDTYLALILHECFHCYQRDYRARADDAHGDLPEDDPLYSALIGLESRLLKATLDTPDIQEARRLAGMFVAVRSERRKDLSPQLVALEGEDEYNEGTATYSATRMYQLLAEQGGMPCSDQLQDPQYRGFSRAKEEYDQLISRIIPPVDQPITFFHAMYQHGMAQCLILDRLRPAWKEEMRTKGMTQFALLETELSLDDAARENLLAEAKSRFAFDGLRSGQQQLVDQRLNLIRGYIAATGRRYRIYHGDIKGRFNWKPAGPVYHVPESLERELAEKNEQLREDTEKTRSRRIVWAGGIRRFEKGTLVLESVATPVIFGQEFIEWIDTTPASDASDMEIKSDSQDGETYSNVRIRTDGFTLQADKVRIEWSPDVVKIHPMPAE